MAKKIFFGVILIFGLSVAFLVLNSKNEGVSDQATLFPLLRLFGKAPQSLSRAITRILPIDGVDEGTLGKEISTFYLHSSSLSEEGKRIEHYLKELVHWMAKRKKKPFDYEVHLLHSSEANSMALPGGVLLVTEGLMKALRSENELVSVLGHEMGHVELSHCMDSVKYEILTKKLIHTDLGQIADFARRLLIAHSFSKNQEDEADEYGYALLVESQYDPEGSAKAFESLSRRHGERSGMVDPLRDYLMSHPPLDSRERKFHALSEAWWRAHAGQKRYVGVTNFQKLTSFLSTDYGSGEWLSR